MNETQKVIKYLAIAFAIFLIVSILSGIMMCFMFFSNLFDDKEDATFTSSNKLEITEAVSSLEIDLRATSTIIREGEKFRIETNNSKIVTKTSNDKLVIKERKGNLFKRKHNYQLVIYLPKDEVYDEVSIDSGAGRIEIEKLATKKLELDLGAGEVEIDELDVLEKMKVEGGAGKFSIHNGKLHNLDLDMGVGKLELTAEVLGNSKIEAGVGETDIVLLGNESDYKIKVDKGIGSASIDGKSVSDNTYYGNGANSLYIDGGVGRIDISFENHMVTEENQSNASEFIVQKYLKDTDQSFLFLGKITSGTLKRGDSIDLLDENNNVIVSTTISLRNAEIYEKEIDSCNRNESCAFLVENIREEEAKLVKKVVLK